MLGAVGWVAGLVNAYPHETMQLWALATAGRYEEARELYRWFMPMLHLDCHVKLVQYIKLAQAMAGLGSETVRAPPSNARGRGAPARRRHHPTRPRFPAQAGGGVGAPRPVSWQEPLYSSSNQLGEGRLR
jgi:hypothetical protein